MTEQNKKNNQDIDWLGGKQVYSRQEEPKLSETNDDIFEPDVDYGFQNSVLPSKNSRTIENN
jgi:hypothetical protein